MRFQISALSLHSQLLNHLNQNNPMCRIAFHLFPANLLFLGIYGSNPTYSTSGLSGSWIEAQSGILLIFLLNQLSLTSASLDSNNVLLNSDLW